MKYRLEIRVVESDGDEDLHEIKNLCIYEGSEPHITKEQIEAMFDALRRRLAELGSFRFVR